MKHTLYWVTQDLRIHDNTALNMASQSDKLLCVYIVDKKWFEPTKYQSKALGYQRWYFLQSCLSDFNQQLLSMGQQLYIVYGDTYSTLTHLCNTYEITNVITTKLPGTYERNLVTKLKNNLPKLAIDEVEQFTLFTQKTLPFELEQLPASYSKFRKLISVIAPPKPIGKTVKLPPMFKGVPAPSLFRPTWLPQPINKEVKQGYYFNGGEQQGLKHLNQYFSSNSPYVYKEVRNNLAGFENSSKISPWLASGCISARQAVSFIHQTEKHKGKNSSTQWLYVELLWREYFQWLHFKNGVKTYQFKGLAKSPPLTSFYSERFAKWCLGNTPSLLVNACMNELRLTGYLSNRGRQIVASYLVNELSIDWRYGAAWFEEHLIDYDAAVNWGNWQYIAGVGVDPRGGRHFNIEKQAALYDPNGTYQAKWTGANSVIKQACTSMDSIDAADWPITENSCD